MMNEEAAQRTDGVERYNGPNLRKKRPKKQAEGRVVTRDNIIPGNCPWRLIKRERKGFPSWWTTVTETEQFSYGDQKAVRDHNEFNAIIFKP
ncbi:hypothetical protein FKM82_001394 [Ascaphus truei]